MARRTKPPHRAFRSIVEAPRARARKARSPHAPSTQGGSPRFLRFASTSLCCTLVDQALAWLLFSVLREPLAGMGFVRILVSNVTARLVSLSLNYMLNRRLVFTLDDDGEGGSLPRKRESLPRYLALSAAVLTLSTIGVFEAHTLFGVVEWKAKLVIDLVLFFLNYNAQRSWVFKTEARVKPQLTGSGRERRR